MTAAVYSQSAIRGVALPAHSTVQQKPRRGRVSEAGIPLTYCSSL